MEDRIVGIITVLKNGEIAQIRGMAVSEDYQGKGIGKKLVEKAEEISERSTNSKNLDECQRNSCRILPKIRV